MAGGMTAAEKAYVRKIFETARYFWEMWEEGTLGDTRAIALHKPADISNAALRRLILETFYKERGLALHQAALEFAKWLDQEGLGPTLDEAMEGELAALCIGASRPFTPVRDVETVIQRSFVRLVRYLDQTRLTLHGAHSRCFEYFLAAAHVPTGFGKNGGNHPEHVVPCAYLRNRCLSRLEQGISIEQTAKEIRPFLAIVMISEDEYRYLDNSPAAGGLGLKDVMPPGWEFESGDIFARLVQAGIQFERPCAMAVAGSGM